MPNLTRALLLTDLVGGAALTEALGSARAAAVWGAHDELARELLVPHRGREIDKTDGFLLLFDTAADAVGYAVAYHAGLRQLSSRLGVPLASRAGLHVGEVVLRENLPQHVARGAKPLEVEGVAKPTAARVMSVARGGQTLLTPEAREALGPTAFRVVSHGRWRMKGVSEPVELVEIGDEDAPFTPPPDGAKVYRVVQQGDLWLPVREVPCRLPAERDPFVGRVAELHLLARQLADGGRLVSVVGAEGSGKTRLVTRFAWTWLGAWPGGAWLADLSEARDVEDVVEGLARALDVELEGPDAVTSLGGRLAERGRCLVILDHAEDVAGPVRELLCGWHREAPEADVLITSTTHLGVPGETVLSLGPLDDDEAVELFAARAAQARRGFVLADDDRRHIQALVRRLGHQPRAVERAAARVRVLSPEQLLARASPSGVAPLEPESPTVAHHAAPEAPVAEPSVDVVEDVRALLVTDVVDSTKLAEALGDVRVAELWAAHDDIARRLLPRHRGLEIDKTDGFLLMFASAAEAVDYALAYHAGLHRIALELGVLISARAGLHVGDVLLRRNPPHQVARGAKPLEVEGPAKQTAERVMSAATGGQTLLTQAARRALGDTTHRVASHGHWRMRGVADPVELFEVGGDDAPFARPADGARIYRVTQRGDLWLPLRPIPHGLPAERDAFVGRAPDLTNLARQLAGGARLVSVLGIGGSGKSRLVTRFAWTWLGDWPGGAWFCDLSEARSADGIVYAVARALDVPLAASDPCAQLGHAIAGRGRTLILLDNFEQVARHARETLGRWLDRAPEASFVVTTREVLGVPGETALALAPLPVDEAMALFVARASKVVPGFALSADDQPHVQALMRLLDGLPLAIELAAARVAQMTPKVLLDKMAQRFDVLASSGDRRTRQSTLRGVLDWSWGLMTLAEQRALAELSVFEGGFDLEAAEAVLTVEPLVPVDALQALVEKSLIRPVADGRFDLLVSVQEYAAGKLDALEARGVAEARHGAHFASYGTDDALDAFHRHGGFAAFRALVVELDNVVVAVRRALTRRDDRVAAAAVRAAASVLQARGPVSVALDLVTAVLDGAALSPLEEAVVRVDLARVYHLLGRSGERVAALEAALPVARAFGARRLEGVVRLELALVFGQRGDLEEARACYEAAARAAREAHDRVLEGKVLGAFADLDEVQGRLEDAAERQRAALAIHREVGNRRFEGVSLLSLAGQQSKRGQHEEAAGHLRDALAAGQDVGHQPLQAYALCRLGVLHAACGRLDEARSALEAAIAVGREAGIRHQEAEILANLGHVYMEQGRRGEAQRCLEGALPVARETDAGSVIAIILINLGLLLRDQGRLVEARAYLVEAREVAVEAKHRAVEAVALRELGRLELLDHRPGDARSYLDASVALFREIDAPVDLGQVLADRARLEHAEGASDLARVSLAEAEAIASACGVGPDSELAGDIVRARAVLEGAPFPR